MERRQDEDGRMKSDIGTDDVAESVPTVLVGDTSTTT